MTRRPRLWCAANHPIESAVQPHPGAGFGAGLRPPCNRMNLLSLAFGEDATILRETNFQLLLLATMFPILGTALVSPILDSMIEPVGASPTTIGLMVSFTTAPPIVFIPIAGVLADRYGRRPVLVVALLLFGGGGTAIALTNDFHVILGLRAVQGVGFAGIVPIITASIGDMYEDGREATGQGLRMMMNGLSGAVFPLVAGSLVVLAWQYPFFLYAAAFPVAAVVLRYFDEPADETAGTGSGANAYLAALYGLVRRPYIATILAARTLPATVWIAFLTYNSLVVVRVMDGTPVQAGVLVALGNIGFALGASQVGRLLSVFRGKFGALAASNVSLGVGFVGFLFAPRPAFAVPWIALAGAGFGVSLALYRSYLTELAPEQLRAGLVSLGASGARVTTTATPIAIGIVIDVASPAIGEAAAIQLAGTGTAVVGGVGGIALLLFALVVKPGDVGATG